MKKIIIIGLLLMSLFLIGCNPTANTTKNLEELEDTGITGDTTLREVSSLTGLCISHIYSDLKLSSSVDSNMPIKNIAKTYNIEFSVEKVIEVVTNIKQSKESHDQDGEIEHERFVEETNCPLGIENDPFPGLCTLYVDEDKDGFCDL